MTKGLIGRAIEIAYRVLGIELLGICSGVRAYGKLERTPDRPPNTADPLSFVALGGLVSPPCWPAWASRSGADREGRAMQHALRDHSGCETSPSGAATEELQSSTGSPS